MSKPETGAGDVKIFLEGHGEEVMRPTLDACRRLSSVNGGINKMIERCRNLEFEAIYTVIVAGLGTDSKTLPELIYKTGLLKLHSPCIDFLIVVSNGGRPLVESEEEDKDPLVKSSQ